MQKIGDKLKLPKDFVELTEEEMIAEFNKDKGNLNEEDGIECSICNNKGYIYFLDEEGYRKTKTCECMKARKTIQRMKQCGITKSMLDRYMFKNFECKDEWQLNLKNKVLDYTKSIVEGGNNWLVVSGLSGSGKTHLCTACFQELIKRGKEGEYLLWNSFVKEIIPMEKSIYEDVQDKYKAKMQRIANVDILYIDDFFKLTESKYNNQATSLAYNIINDRYNNNKITIISTEYYPQQIESIDTAICGRINERCDFGKYWLKIKNDPTRNYRMNTGEEI